MHRKIDADCTPHVRWFLLLTIIGMFVLLQATQARSQGQVSFSDAEVRYVKDDKRELDFDDAVLTLDSTTRRLHVKTAKHPLDISFDDVEKVVVEVNTLGKKAGFGASFLGMFAGGLLFGNAIATSIDKPFKNDHFVYLEIKKPNGGTSGYLLSIGKDSTPQAMNALKAAFGERLIIPVFEEKLETVDKAPLADQKIRLKAVATDKQHPMPELRPDKALVVVTCPATIMVRVRQEKGMYGAALFAGEKLVGFNGPGTYNFFYLDPGEYMLTSVTKDAVGLRMKVEAGKEYYLIQTFYAKGIFLRSLLVRHSKEVTMFEVGGSLWADWKIDEKEK